jgi:hypothetical protein
MSIQKKDGTYWITVKLINGNKYTVVNPNRLKGLRIASRIALA